MKVILISIQPKWVAKILNGEKTIEIRKTMPKCDLPIHVYIYCTKDKEQLTSEYSSDIKGTKYFIYNDNEAIDYRGKVVAKFTLNKVHSFYYFDKDLLALACISQEEALKYMGKNEGYAWKIDDLVIFDKPKELSEFSIRCPKADVKFNGVKEKMLAYKQLTKAPQSWCYVEVVEWN